MLWGSDSKVMSLMSNVRMALTLEEALDVLDAGRMAHHGWFLIGQKVREMLYVHLQLRTNT